MMVVIAITTKTINSNDGTVQLVMKALIINTIMMMRVMINIISIMTIITPELSSEIANAEVQKARKKQTSEKSIIPPS